MTCTRWLQAQEGWVPLGAADEKKAAVDGTVEAWGRAEDNPVGGWYGQRKGYRGRFGMYLPPLLEALGLAELTHDRAQQHDASAVMAQQTTVRYTTRDASAADANQSLIDAVFAELADVQPDGLSYRVSRAPDGVSFEHVAVVEGEPNPLLALASFRAFSTTIADRVVGPPDVQTGEVVARYH